MKYLTFLLTLVFMWSCSSEPHTVQTPQSKKVYVVLDYTEGQEYSSDDVNFNKIFKAVGGGVTSVSVQPIRDQSFAKHSDIDLSFEDHSGNEYMKRQMAAKMVKEGDVKFGEVLSNFNGQFAGKEMRKSAIVNNVCDVLSTAKSGDYVVVFSDFLENYSGTNFRTMKPTQIQEYLNTTCSPNSGVNFIGVTEAFREKDDKYMRSAIPAWEGFFETNNISFTSTTNL